LIDGSVPQVKDAGLSQGPAVAGSSHIAGSAAVGSFAATAPMLAELKRFLSNELCSFKEELKRQNDESINSAVKKMRLQNSARHSFRSKGNEEQYIHQEKVATCFDNAIQVLHSDKLHEVRNALEEELYQMHNLQAHWSGLISSILAGSVMRKNPTGSLVSWGSG